MTTERKTLTVSRASWHGRAYSYWRQHGSFKTSPAYKENLCHYWRVVLFWAPLAWFVHATPDTDNEIVEFVARPITITAILGVIGGIVAAFVLAPAGSLKGLFIFLAIVVVVSLLVGGFWMTEEEVGWWMAMNKGLADGVVFIAKAITKIVVLIYKVLLRWWVIPLYRWFLWPVVYRHALLPLGRALDRAGNWAFGDDGWPIFIAICAIIAAGALGGIVAFAITHTFAFLVVLGAVVAAAIVGAGLWFTREFWANVVGKPTASFTRVAVDSAVSKKHGICPFIEVVD